eukprot:5047738-Lingulodinium_polyedra.AAC.1
MPPHSLAEFTTALQWTTSPRPAQAAQTVPQAVQPMAGAAAGQGRDAGRETRRARSGSRRAHGGEGRRRPFSTTKG